MNSPKISVIVPVYNGEKYLRNCIDSILNQTLTNIELLLIDDGSKDLSSIICDEYAAIDSRCRVFHKENGGVSSARSVGWNNARGEWIGFVDSDDMISPSYYSDLLGGKHIDSMIVCAAPNNTQISRDDYVRDLLVNRMDWGMPTKLYHCSLFKNDDLFVPREVNIGEDLITNLLVSRYVEWVSVVNAEGYFYRDNKESVTHTRDWSLQYATFYLQWVEKALGDAKDLYKKEFWKLQMVAWKNLIYNGVPVKTNLKWIKYLKAQSVGEKTNFGEKILLYSPNSMIAFVLLRFLHGIKSVLRVKG